MIAYSTREAAKKLGITEAALSRYIKAGKVPMPKIVQIGRMRLHSWSESDIEQLRELLPKIANGRKTWRQKKRSVKPKSKPKKKTQPGAAVPHEQQQKNVSHGPRHKNMPHKQRRKRKKADSSLRSE